VNGAAVRCACAWLLVTTLTHADEQQASTIEQQPVAAASSSLPQNAESQAPSPSVAPTIVAEPDRTETGQPLSEADLDSYHGGAATVTANQTVTAVTSHNVLNGDYTAGSVTLSGEALANFDGFGNFAINTGAQVSIQSAMSVTINVGD
jgi:hypothetical protein